MRSNTKSEPRNRILIGDVRKKLGELAAESVDTIITSPPYFRLRNYQHVGQIGLEKHVDSFVDELRVVARGLLRVLKPTGSLWLNLGDTYSQADSDGAPRKNLLLVPERVALALQADGWILRNKIIWAKPNPMPSSVNDRMACTYEVVYFFTKSRRYFFDLDAVRVPHKGSPKLSVRAAKSREQSSPKRSKAWSVPESWRGPSSGSNGGLDRLKTQGLAGHPLGKNPGDVWTIPTAGYRGAHHAVFPEKLVERPLLATCPEKVCVRCNVPWARAKSRRSRVHSPLGKSCSCDGSATKPGVVLDPFFGSGTTGLVAHKHGRDWIGIELNNEFAELASSRLVSAQSDEPTFETKNAA